MMIDDGSPEMLSPLFLLPACKRVFILEGITETSCAGLCGNFNGNVADDVVQSSSEMWEVMTC